MGLFSWLGQTWQTLKGFVTPRRPARGADPRPALAGAAPGLWSSNHLAEAAQCKGWQFVAIRALAKMCAAAEVGVHEVGSKKDRVRRARRALHLAWLSGDSQRLRHWRDRLKRLKRLKLLKRAQKAAGSTGSATPPDAAVPASDELLRLLLRTNPEWSLETFLFQAVQQLSLTGSCIVWCVRDEMGYPRELYVLPTGLVTPRLPTAAFPKGSYYLTPLSTWGLAPPGDGDGWAQGTLGSALLTGCEIDSRDVKAIRWPHPLYLSDGLAPLSAIAVWVDVANQMELSNWYGLQNTERPGMVFSRDPKVEPDPADLTQFREDLSAEHAGTPNTGKHLILPPGISADQRARTPVEMDFAVSRPQYRDMNLAAHGVSPIACGITEAGSFSALYAALKQTSMLAAQPMLRLVAGELTELLGDSFDGPRRRITLTAPAVDDPQIHEARLKTGVTAGNVITVDEYRGLLKLPALGGEKGEAFAGARPAATAAPGVGPDGKPDGRIGDDDPDDEDTGTRREDRDAVAGRPDRGGKSITGMLGRLLRGLLREFREEDHPRRDDGKFGEGAGDAKDEADKKPGKKKPAKKEDKGDKDGGPSSKPKARRGEMRDARREGEGKEARVVLADGTPAPAHVTAAMVGADWSDVKICLDPEADVLVTGKDKQGRAKTVYADHWHMKAASSKFARVREGVHKAHEMYAQVQAHRKGDDEGLLNSADCTWLMMEQATRPGSESDNKGVARHFGHKVTKKDVLIEGDKLHLQVGKAKIEIKDKKAKAELKRRVEHNLPLFDSTFWLKSHGATTLEGRHVVERDGAVYLEFMGKESVWHSHKVRSHDLAAMLLERRAAAGEGGKLFNTDYEKVSKYVKSLDGKKFSPKDLRTIKATSLAAEEIARMPVPADEKERKKAISAVGARVSHVLGNEAAQALKSYVAPEVFSVWETK